MPIAATPAAKPAIEKPTGRRRQSTGSQTKANNNTGKLKKDAE
jgi:hypothetical protein